MESRLEEARGRLIPATPGDILHTLDPGYRMRNKDYEKFLSCGRVFKTLWTGPAAQQAENGSENDQFMSKQKFKVASGEYIYTKI